MIMRLEYRDLLYQLLNFVNHQDLVIQAWFGGSIAHQVEDSYSNVNLYIRLKPNNDSRFVESLSEQKSITIFSVENMRSETNITAFDYSKHKWVNIILFADNEHEYKKRDKLVPLSQENISAYSKRTNALFRLVNDWDTEFQFTKEAIKVYIEKSLLDLRAIAIAIGRMDKIYLQITVEKFKNRLLETYLLIEKCGHNIDINRVEPYLHPTIRELLTEVNTFTTSLTDQIVNESIKRTCELLIDLFAVNLYRYERVMGKFDTNKLIIIQDFWNEVVGWEINLHPKQDQLLNSYTENLAKSYDDARPMSSEMIQGLKLLGKEYLMDRDILELGVGTGRISLNIIPFANQYTGIEQSPFMLQKFNEKLTSSNKNAINVTIDNSDIMLLNNEFPTQKFDVIIEHEVMLFTLNPINVVDQIFDRLNKGGHFIRLVTKRDADSIYNKLLDIFHQAVYECEQTPFIVKGVGIDNKITFYLHRKKIKTKKHHLSSWIETFSISDFIKMLNMRPFPYLDSVSQDSINTGIKEVEKYHETKLSKQEYFDDKKELFFYISQNPEGE